MTAKDLNAIVGCNSGRDVTDARKISGLRDDEDEPSVTAYCLAVCSDKSLYFELGDKDRRIVWEEYRDHCFLI